MQDMHANGTAERGFTLIEIAVVLVVIGLIVGGVLVGQSLIAAATVRAQITQIEQYQTATAAFREKYGYLPGDIPAGPAAQFGFIARGPNRGQGDGNGVIEASSGSGLGGATGEQIVFWVDLSTARLIDGGFSTATIGGNPGSSAVISQYFPQAKLGNGNYIYVFSGGWSDNSGASGGSNGVNYFGLNTVGSLSGGCACLYPPNNLGLTVNQAYSIDAKIDDGLPLTGNVLAAYLESNNWMWTAPGWPINMQSNIPPPTSNNLAPSASTCFDNGGNSGNTMKYSFEVSNGTNVNCALVFKFQAGD